MKRVKIVIFILLLFLFINVEASNGPLKQNSIIECNGMYYGKHGTPAHWHKAEKKNDRWISVGDEVSLPPCYIKVPNEKEKVLFSKCSDGDTAWFLVNGVEKKVRFLAIDTPETSGEKKDPLGKVASDYTCNALKNAKEIYLEYDGASDKEDKYGRLLAFIYVDGELLEKKLIQNGLAKVAYIYGDYEHVDELRKEEEIAKNNKVGMWSDNENLPDVSDNSSNEENSDEVDEETSKLIEILNLIFEIIKKIFALLFN